VPGVEPPTVVRVVVLVLPMACASAGAAAMSDVAMMMAETAFMPRQREYFSGVPSRDWPRQRASARVA